MFRCGIDDQAGRLVINNTSGQDDLALKAPEPCDPAAWKYSTVAVCCRRRYTRYPRLPMVHPDFTFDDFLTTIGCPLKGYQVWFSTEVLKGKDILLTKEVWPEAKLCMASGKSVLVEIKGEHCVKTHPPHTPTHRVLSLSPSVTHTHTHTLSLSLSLSLSLFISPPLSLSSHFQHHSFSTNFSVSFFFSCSSSSFYFLDHHNHCVYFVQQDASLVRTVIWLR